jgi:ring-1,2-phenylacetyl-CoA epoxidase subunit PaaE
MSNKFFDLPVKELRQETDDTVTVVFAVPAEHQETFQYQHGQYLTLKFDIKGQEERRSYSMSSSPLEEDLAVTVKRVPKGTVSNHIADHLKVGQRVAVMPPEGRFTIGLDPDKRRTFYLIGAGSGITPLMSILKTVLEKEPQSTVHLLYGNRREDTIIFSEALDRLSQRYAGQLTVDHVLSRPKKVKSKGLSGLLGKGQVAWTGKTGRIRGEILDAFLRENPQRTSEAEYFICGPSGMMELVESYLISKQVDKQHLHLEYFTPVGSDQEGGANGTRVVPDAEVEVELDGEEFTVTVPKGKTILDVLLAEKYDPPYSCTSGACSTCMAKVLEGSVKMDVCLALDEEEVEEGYILTCQSHPTKARIKITYEV